MANRFVGMIAIVAFYDLLWSAVVVEGEHHHHVCCWKTVVRMCDCWPFGRSCRRNCEGVYLDDQVEDTITAEDFSHKTGSPSLIAF